jgi:hypothetical protein
MFMACLMASDTCLRPAAAVVDYDGARSNTQRSPAVAMQAGVGRSCSMHDYKCGCCNISGSIQRLVMLPAHVTVPSPLLAGLQVCGAYLCSCGSSCHSTGHACHRYCSCYMCPRSTCRRQHGAQRQSCSRAAAAQWTHYCW